VITDWFRPEAYYRSGGWRATWSGEGGGVLLNQCPHQLDLWQWLFGMPRSVTASCQFGRFHDIEVEDSVSALLEYGNGCQGVFVATTGEAPGENRLSLACDRGLLVVEREGLRFVRTEVPVPEFSRTTDERFSKPETREVWIPCEDRGEQHLGILKNFAAAILDGEALIAPALEGIHSVELANAMLLSSLKQRRQGLPIDAAEYENELGRLISQSETCKSVRS
jgi:predicted dehydrogenase